MLVPSGDHVGPQSLPAAHGAAAPATHPLSWRGVVPSARTTQMPSLSGMPLAYAIDAPSGLHVGSWSFGTEPVVTAWAWLPSAFMTQTCWLTPMSWAKS